MSSEPAPKVAVILAGGQSLRFGSDKCFYVYDGVPMLERVIRVCQAAGFEVYLSGSKAKLAFFKLPIIEDPVPFKGPLMALKNIFDVLKFQRVMLLSCDMPKLTPEFLDFMWQYGTNFDSVAVNLDGYLQTLPAIYSRKNYHQLGFKEHDGLNSFFSFNNTLIVEENVLREFGFSCQNFDNINERKKSELIKKKTK